jgi:hypothetical protein
MHRAIADKLRARPELIEIAWDNIERWYESSGGAKPYLDQWRRLLEYPPEELFSLMCRDDERMAALRQSSPFAGVLEPKERWAIYERFARDLHNDE